MQDLDKFKNDMNLSGKNVYVGYRYVPKIMGDWDNAQIYEPLSIVQYQGASYTSRQYVPVGVEITNGEYWAVTGNYNAQVEQYRQDVRNLQNEVKGFNDDLIQIETGYQNADTTLKAEIKSGYETADTALKTLIDTERKQREIYLSDFGAVGNANFYDSKTDTWYENGTYSTNLGQEYNPEAYFNPHNKNYYESASFSNEATDNTQALQTALDYIANSEYTKILVIDTGNFLINETIYFDYSNITITGYGENSKLIAGNNITKALFYSDHGTRQNGLMQRLKITNIALFGNHKENYYGILFTGLDRGSLIEDNKIYGFGKDQIALISSWGFTINRNILNGYYRLVDGERNYYGNGLTMGLDTLGVEYNVFSVNIPVVTGNTFQFLEIGLEYYYGAGGTIHGNNFENIDSYWMRINYVKGVAVNGNYFEDLRVGSYGVLLGSNNVGDAAIAIDFTGNKFMLRQRLMQDIFIRNISESVIKANAHDTRPEEIGNDIYFSAQISSTIMYGNDINVRQGNVGALTTAIQANNNIKQMGSGV